MSDKTLVERGEDAIEDLLQMLGILPGEAPTTDEYRGEPYARTIARAVLEAVIPAADATGRTLGLRYAEWHDPHHGRRWLVKASDECDGAAVVSDGGIAIGADHAEARGLALIAAAREARRLAGSSVQGVEQ